MMTTRSLACIELLGMPRDQAMTVTCEGREQTRSMRLEISALEALGDEATVIRGPGVCGRSGYQPGEPAPVTITSRPEPS